MTARFFAAKNAKKLILLSSALIFLAPFRLTIADEREFRVVDEGGTTITGVEAKQVWNQYSLRFERAETRKADADGHVLFPKRVIYTNLFFSLSGAIGQIIRYQIHASIESSDSIGVHAEGYEWSWFHDGKGLENKLVVLKRK